MTLRRLLLLPLLLLAGCGRSATNSDLAGAAAPAAPRFTLRELPAAGGLGAGTLGLRTSLQPDGGVLAQVTVVKARALTGACYAVDYDAARFTPTGAQFLNTLAPTDRLLTLSDFQAAGTVQHAAVIKRPGPQDGFSGDGVLAEIRFAPRPFARAASKAPKSARSQATLNLDQDSLTLSWGYANEGDYDQNSEVNAADLAPLGTNFLETTGGAGPFPPGSKFAMIDGDQNGELNIADLSPIGTNIQRIAASYNVYQSTDAADIPNGLDPSTIAPLGFVNIGDGIAAAPGEQKRFSFTVPELKTGWFYWVRPADAPDGAGAEGVPSNVVSFGGKPGNEQPLASLSADPLAGDAPLTVSFDAAASSDPDGSIVQFAWDFDGDGTIDATSAEPAIQHLYQSGGVFEAAVQVIDDGADTASASVTVTVTDPANLPPVADLTLDFPVTEVIVEGELDASASSDPDGTLVNFEWDFDGDGTFDAVTGTQASTFHIYVNPGDFTPAVRVTDDAGATDTAQQPLTLTASSDRPPVAAIEDVTAGDSDEMTRTFSATGSSDPDGTLVKFEWDLDGDGLFEADTANVPTITFQYLTHGLKFPAVRVTDDDANTAESSTRISITLQGKLQPTAKVVAAPESGAAPLAVTFTVSDAFDQSATFTSFVWDFQDDFVDDQTTAVPTATFTYTTDGLKRCKVKATNADGQSSTARVVVGVGLAPPVAKLTASPQIGTDPHVVQLDASASFDFDGGTIVKYEWDLDDDIAHQFELDGGSNPLQSVTHTVAGPHGVAVRVTDDEGATATIGVGLTTLDPDNTPPDVDLLVTPSLAAAPADITFDASGSTDDEGIRSFSWDFNGDGDVDANTATPTVTLRLAMSGVHTATVEVRDVDGVVASASADYELTGGFKRSIVESGEDSPRPMSPIVTGAGSLARARLTYISGTSITSPTQFTSSTSALGDAWGAPVPINAPAAIRRTISARIVNGRPAVAYEEGEDIFYARATSTSGSAWGAPLLVDGSGENRQAALLVAGGRPAIAYVDERGSNNDHVLFIRASDADGAAWPASSVIVRDADLDNELGPQALTLGGNPALFFGDRPSQSLQLAVATSSAGSAWGEPVTVVNGSTSSVLSTGLVSGNPACVFMGGVGELLYLRADDTGGGSWSGSPVVIADQLRFESRASEQAPSPTLLVSGGLPCVSFVDRTNQMIKLVRASDQNGAAWDDPMIIDFGRIFFGNSAATVLDGKPLVFYVDEFVRESDRFFVTEMIALREQ